MNTEGYEVSVPLVAVTVSLSRFFPIYLYVVELLVFNVTFIVFSKYDGLVFTPFVLFMFYYDYCVYLHMLVYNTISISDKVLVNVTRWLPPVEKALPTTPVIMCSWWVVSVD